MLPDNRHVSMYKLCQIEFFFWGGGGGLVIQGTWFGCCTCIISKVAMIHIGSGHQLVFFVVTLKVKCPIVLMFMSKWKSRILMILTFFVSKDLWWQILIIRSRRHWKLKIKSSWNHYNTNFIHVMVQLVCMHSCHLSSLLVMTKSYFSHAAGSSVPSCCHSQASRTIRAACYHW